MQIYYLPELSWFCFTADIPEMTLKSLCLDLYMAISFEDFNCRCLEVLLSKWAMTYTSRICNFVENPLSRFAFN